jgi:hypothetical protein
MLSACHESPAIAKKGFELAFREYSGAIHYISTSLMMRSTLNISVTCFYFTACQEIQPFRSLLTRGCDLSLLILGMDVSASNISITYTLEAQKT